MPSESRRRTFERGQGIEFDRVVNFSDAVYAIAATLLILDVGIPEIREHDDAGAMFDALWDRLPEFVSFALAFFFIARYWLAHHAFIRLLQSFDGALITWNLCYLAFVAFLPFPTALFGEYEDNAIAVVLFGMALAVVSALEVVMFDHAWRARLLTRDMPEEVFRWGRATSAVPVVLIVLSLPFVLVSPSFTPFFWLLILPAELLLDRKKPAGSDEYFR